MSRHLAYNILVRWAKFPIVPAHALHGVNHDGRIQVFGHAFVSSLLLLIACCDCINPESVLLPIVTLI